MKSLEEIQFCKTINTRGTIFRRFVYFFHRGYWKRTFFLGFDIGAGTAGGVDGLLVLLGRGGGSFLAEDDGFPILGKRAHTGHVCLCVCLVMEWLCIGFVMFVREASNERRDEGRSGYGRSDSFR